MLIYFGHLLARIRTSDYYPNGTFVLEVRFVDDPDFDLGHDYAGSFQDCIKSAIASFADLG